MWVSKLGGAALFRNVREEGVVRAQLRHQGVWRREIVLYVVVEESE